MRAINLKTEYLNNPVGIDFAAPRLSWHCEGGVTQTAWQIEARGGSGELLWDSDRVSGDKMTLIPWGGPALGSRAVVRWRVRLWDENDRDGGWSGEAFFELGLLRPEDWSAKWISGDYRPKKSKRYPVDCFRRKFTTKPDVTKAQLYITACGLYEAKLNGQRVGNFILAPGITDYKKRIQYQTYDVTELLRQGENELTVQLADGWYRGSTGAWGLRNQYGTETKLLCQLELEYEDGTGQTIVSDKGWQWSDNGPIRFADNKDGEVIESWRQPSYSRFAKETVCGVVPSASNNVPVTEHERFSPQITVTPGGKRLLDFGQNIAGYVEFKINAKKGQRIFLRFGELVGRDGELTLENIQCRNRKKITPLQQVEYFCRDGENDYKTRFAIFGFRYVEVDTELTIHPENVTAIAVYSDMAETGQFDSSNEQLNQFVNATLWSAKGNSADLPTDCPTRERHGWTGDAQIFFETAGYLLDYAPFAAKYLRDVFDWQEESGRLPQIAPAGGVDFYMSVMNGSVGWADAGVLIPYRFCKLYGDRRILEAYYDRMKKYASFMMRRCGRWGGPFARRVRVKRAAKRYLVNRGQSYGEWAEPADVNRMRWTDVVSPHPEVSTAYTAYIMTLMAEIAAALGKTEDERLYTQYADGCKSAYQALAETPAFSLDTDRQARLVRPLAFRLLDGRQEEYAKTRLLQAMEAYGWRLGTGFLSTPLILDVLVEIDTESAYRLLENEEMPGWLFMSKNGATTVWESWEGTHAQGGIASLNHYSKGACCRWLFDTMCGIHISGENHFTIAPRPGGSFKFAKACYTSVFGRITSGWEQDGSTTIYTIEIPPNTTAEVVLPKGTRKVLYAGVHTLYE